MKHCSQHNSSKVVAATAALFVELRWDFSSRLLQVAAQKRQTQDSQRRSFILQRQSATDRQHCQRSWEPCASIPVWKGGSVPAFIMPHLLRNYQLCLKEFFFIFMLAEKKPTHHLKLALIPIIIFKVLGRHFSRHKYRPTAGSPAPC